MSTLDEESDEEGENPPMVSTKLSSPNKKRVSPVKQVKTSQSGTKRGIRIMYGNTNSDNNNNNNSNYDNSGYKNHHGNATYGGERRDSVNTLLEKLDQLGVPRDLRDEVDFLK